MADGATGLVLRVDGSSTVGGGHLSRCLSVAQAWRGLGGRAKFAAAETVPMMASRIRDAGFEIVSLEAAPGSAADAVRTAVIAASDAARAIVLDGYDFDLAYQAALRKSAQGTVLAVYDDEDVANRFDCDILVNQNVYARAAHYAGRAGRARVLAGPRFTAIRREILDLAEQPVDRAADGPFRVFVSLGLSDTTDSLTAVLEALSTLDRDGLRIDIVAGAGDLHRIEATAASCGCDVGVVATTPRFAQMAHQADVAIVAAGGSANEVACLGTAMIMLCIADNQRPAYEHYVRSSAAVAGGTAAEIDVDAIVSAVARMRSDRTLRRDIADRARSLFDGEGAKRVAREIMRRVEEPADESHGRVGHGI